MFVYVLDKKKDHKIVIIASVVASLAAASICLFLAWRTCKRKGKIFEMRVINLLLILWNHMQLCDYIYSFLR